LIAGAEDAYSVATLTARGALTGLKVSDRVFVSNDGDGKWALYIVTTVTDGKGSTSEFTKVADEDLFTNALSKEAVKSAYESNANTNAFTDAEKTKVGHITVTQAVNLDTIESGLASTTTTANSALSTANSASTAAAAAQTTANTARSDASAAQTTANTAVSDAAASQSTADSALRDAGDAQAAAEAAQTTADSGVTKANTARTEAAAAQSTANSALTAANARELAFIENIEDFTALSGEATVPVAISLAKNVADGFVPLVFFNGIRVKTISFTAGAKNLTFTVPYITEPTDTISVQYASR
jgi:flagellin-like hook-associated protein FlgL